ncbi:MAG: ABC transporter ATP-binding protein [Planctomycetota bacterium]|nr:ABC transporter ATP-binding protein [Planctomycetota bacterium]
MPVLEVSGLKKAYRSPDGDLAPVIDIERFSLDHGAEIALRGGSGSGKTTFLNLIAGVLSADEGEIVVDGHRVTGVAESDRDGIRARTIGYVFQTFNLLQGYTALENVLLGMMFGPGADRERAASLLERVGLADRMHYHPRQLSVGQQQRVALARALANHPPLVLADEPTGNLDPRRATESLGLMREICRENDAAILLVSHDRTILDAFENVVDLAEINRAHG